MEWKAEGCYQDWTKKLPSILNNTFKNVQADKENLDIQKIFDECRAEAEAKDYEIFAIQVSVIIYSTESLYIELETRSQAFASL